MQAPDGYIVKRRILETREKRVSLGLREADDRTVVLKAYASDRPGSPHEGRAARELEAIRALAPGVAPSPLALEQTTDGPVLVLECLPGAPPHGPLPARSFLSVAMQAAQALAAVHAARLVHRGVSPENLLLDPTTQKLWLIGFGRAAPLGAPASSAGATLRIDSLFYRSPEESERLERGVDFRSDLYSLGATFYDLLTGRPPFDARDPSDLIQAHIARRARPPSELVPELPSTLSRITMKLLAKEPEDRYQTADALHVDLETCLEQLERIGHIDDELPLASADAPYRPLFRRRVYGRSQESGILVEAYRRAARGSRELVLVSGSPGVGKSALVPELHRPLAIDGGYLARGKCDLYRSHLPYAALANSLRSLVQQILGESGKRREAWRLAVSAELGHLAGVVNALLPELREILGAAPDAPPLDPGATQARLAVTVRRLVRAAALQAAPLVLFLDDLQWSDSGTLYLIEEMLLDDDQIPLLVIGSYRNNEVGPGHPLFTVVERLEGEQRAVTRLHLDVLSDVAVAEMVGDALAKTPDEVAELAHEIARKSGKNPLLIQQCAYHLQELGGLGFAKGEGWIWDLDAIERAVIPDDPAGMMLTRLQRLNGSPRSIVQLASCVGDEFDVGLLAELCGEKPGELQTSLYELSDEGLIAPCPAGFRFVHDRIREAAQSLLPDEHRVALHHRIAKLLIANLSDAEKRERCFEVADHLARARNALGEPERLEAAQWQSEAAQVALAAGAIGTAAHYLQEGREILGPAGWSARPDLAFQLWYCSAFCAFNQREFESALELISGLDERCTTVMQMGLVASLRIVIYDAAKSRAEALELLCASLQRLGVHAVPDPSWIRTRLALMRLEWKLRGPPDRWQLRSESGPRDERRAAERSIRIAGLRLQTATSARLACLAAVEQLEGILQDGYALTPALPIVMLAASRRAFLRSSRGVERYVSAARLWLERVPHPKPNPEFLMRALALPWIAPRRPSIEPLGVLATAMEEEGQTFVATSAWVIRANYAGLSGVALAEVCGAFDAIRARSGMSPVESPRELVRPYRWLLETMDAHGEITPEVHESIERLERHADSAYYAAPHWMQALTVRGRFEEVWHVSEVVQNTIFDCQALASHVMDYVLYRGIAAAVLSAAERPPAARPSLRRAAKRCERELARAARYGPDFVHMAEVVRAERLRARGRLEAARESYRAAATRAEAESFVNHAALIVDRMASLARDMRDAVEASRCDEHAARLFASWGASRPS